MQLRLSRQIAAYRDFFDRRCNFGGKAENCVRQLIGRGIGAHVDHLDGFRISIRRVYLNESYDHIKVVIPGKTLNEIIKIINGGIEDTVNIYFDDKHVLFEFDDTIVLSRLIEGEYYKIDQMLSGDYETKVTINKSQLFGSVDRASLLIRDSEKKPIIVTINDGNVKIEVNTHLGSMDEDIDAVKEGTDIMIAFNPKFLLDALKVIDDEQIDMYFKEIFFIIMFSLIRVSVWQGKPVAGKLYVNIHCCLLCILMMPRIASLLSTFALCIIMHYLSEFCNTMTDYDIATKNKKISDRWVVE